MEENFKELFANEVIERGKLQAKFDNLKSTHEDLKNKYIRLHKELNGCKDPDGTPKILIDQPPDITTDVKIEGFAKQEMGANSCV